MPSPNEALMIDDLLPVQRLQDNLQAVDRLQREQAAILTEEGAALEAAARAAEALAAARAAVDAGLASLRQTERRLEVFQKRAGDTRRLIDSGKATDFLLARQQLESCVQVVDEAETAALEQMEARDAALAGRNRAEAAVAEATRRLERARASREERLPVLERELASLLAARPPLERDIPTDCRDGVRRLRAQGRSLLSPLTDGACALCGMRAAPQVVLEVDRGSRIHACRSCGRFLVAVPD
jgi:predicted  nucleic acid-binding Zn-ribbon protein